MPISRSVLVATALVASVAIAGAALAVSRLDATRAASTLREVIGAATGREVEIRGASRIEMGLPPNLVFERLVIAAEREGPPLAEVERVELVVEILPLLFARTIRVASVAVEGAQVTGEIPDLGDRPLSEEDPPFPGEIRLRDVRWTRSGADSPVVAVERALVEATRNGRASFRGRGALFGRVIDLRGHVGPIDAWASADGEVDLDASGSIDAVGIVDVVARLQRGAAGELHRIEGSVRADHLSWPASDEPAEARRPGDLFPETPLPLGSLDRVDVALDLSASTVSLGGTRLREVSGGLRVERGALRIADVHARVGGGTIDGSGTLDGSKRPPSFSLTLGAKDVDLAALLREAGASGRLRGGVASAEARLDGRGATPAAIAASLDGEVKALVGPARVRTTIFDSLVVGPEQILGKMTGQRSAWTRIECAAATFAVRDGVAKPEILLAATPRTTLVGHGRIDLGKERVDLEIAPATKITDGAIGLPLTVRGPLARPRAEIDELGVARKVAGLVSIAAFPPAAITSLTELGSETHPCVAIAAGRRPDRESGLVRGARAAGETVIGGLTDGARELGETVGIFGDDEYGSSTR